MNDKTLYTWLDVEFLLEQVHLSGKLPPWILRYSVYQDQLSFTITNRASEQEVAAFLDNIFGARYTVEKGIALESAPGRTRYMIVDIEKSVDDGTGPAAIPPILPSFRKMAAFPETAQNLNLPQPLASDSPEVIAFYSFKGGVGRTTHLLGYLESLTRQKEIVKILVIDADLEAPGITSLLRHELSFGAADFSFVDFLGLAQSDDTENYIETLDLAAYAIKRQALTISSGGHLCEHYFLPSFRSEIQAMRLDIRPEHFAKRPGKAWVLTDLLAALGRRLGVGAILLDLRAGYSELASPFLFDPRVRRVLVTTPSTQSLDGTANVLRQLGKFVSQETNYDVEDPVVVLSFVLSELVGTQLIEDIRVELQERYPDVEGDTNWPNLQVLTTLFSQELLYFSSITDAIKKLESTSVARVMAELVEVDLPLPIPTGEQRSREALDTIRERLTTLAGDLEYAESGRGEGFLRTAALRALARQFSNQPPIAVVIGSKGSGKTYTYLQLVRAKQWANFVSEVNNDVSGTQALFWPLFQSRNLDRPATTIVDECKRTTSVYLGTATNGSGVYVEELISEALRSPNVDEIWWRHKWFEIFAKTLGTEILGFNTAGSLLINFLKKSAKQLIIVIDGLEDLFPNISDNIPQQIALRALVQGIPAYLREVPENPLGIVVFARADLARSAVPQNYGQFSKLYEAFALHWNEEEALRLAAWLASSAGLVLAKSPESMTTDEAKEALLALWGRKLGSEKSREARSAEWVIAALSDFKGQIQARDLVRFLHFAAEGSLRGSAQDRVLQPAAIRNAIVPCSKQKILEIEEEIPTLKAIFAKLRKIPDPRIPFDGPSAGLTTEDIRFLESVGVIADDRGEYFMPEIFRLGLGFKLAEGARPRVLSLARRIASGDRLR